MRCDLRPRRFVLVLAAACAALAGSLQAPVALGGTAQTPARIVGRLFFVGGGISSGSRWSRGLVIVSTDSGRFVARVRVRDAGKGFEITVKPGVYLLEGHTGSWRSGWEECRLKRVRAQPHRTVHVVVDVACGVS